MTISTPAHTSWIDRLRAFITLLVIAHHSALAYFGPAIFNKDAYILSTHPVVDKHRWLALDGFIGFNDTFFMPLMFLISGLFTLPSLRRKGRALFIRDRFRRLFVPFLVAVTLFMWIAYYPAWLLAGKPPGIRDYLIDFFTVEAWPVGPPWFIWVLFLFNIITALLYSPLLSLLTFAAGHIRKRPFTAVLSLFVLSMLLYVPAALVLGSYTWTGVGPFDFQKSRLLLYFGYFLLGATIGITDFDKGLFSADSLFVRRWPLWITASLAAYLLQLRAVGVYQYNIAFATTMATASIAALTTFKALTVGTSRIWQSLSGNAYGMYLVHYVFVVWLQYGLLPFDWSAGIKFMLVFILSTLASWVTAGMFRAIGGPKTKVPARAGT
ncbi:MAG: acyltransferase [Chitinophagaceae bacterium]|nr:acyltransferase [Chitinophagaceae bacterium]